MHELRLIQLSYVNNLNSLLAIHPTLSNPSLN